MPDVIDFFVTTFCYTITLTSKNFSKSFIFLYTFDTRMEIMYVQRSDPSMGSKERGFHEFLKNFAFAEILVS